MRFLKTFILASIPLLATIPTLAQAPTPSLEEAAGLMASQDWPGAVTAFRALTEAEPTNPAAWFGLGRSLFNSHQVDGALEAYHKALELGFQPARTMIHLARCHSIKGEDDQAITWLEKAAATGANIYQALETTQEFNRLRSKPAFTALIDKLRPCNSPEHRLLDFWVGSWRVVSGQADQQVGKNTITKIFSPFSTIT